MQITLKAARVNAGLTQVEAAKRLSISPLTLAKYENGNAYPNVEMIKAIEKVYGLTYNDIIFCLKNTE